MLNQEQEKYVDTIRTGYPGLDTETLRKTFSDAGWSPEQIIEALQRYSVAPPEIAPLPQAPQPSALVSTPLPASDALPQENTEVFTPTRASSSGTKRAVIIAGIIIFFLGATGAAGYFILTKTSLFAPKVVPLVNGQVLDQVATKLAAITIASYDVTFGLGVADRDADATAFSIAVPLSPEALAAYQRDEDRLRDIEKLRSAVTTEFNRLNPYAYDYQPVTVVKKISAPVVPKPRLYPESIVYLAQKMTDPEGKPYVYARAQDGTGYTLTATFETQDAADVAAAKGAYSDASSTAKKMNGKTVTLSQNDNFYAGSFKGRPTQPKLFGLFEMSEIENYIPANLSGNFTLAGTVDDAKATTPIDARIEISGDASFSDFTVAFDAEGIKKGNNYYGIVKKMPAFFSSMSQIRGKWISLTEEDLKQYGYSSFYDSFVPNDETDRKKKFDEARKEWKTLLDLANQEGVVTISKGPEKVMEGKIELTKYQLIIDKDKLLPFYEHATKELATYGDASILKRDENTVTYMKSDDFSRIFAYLKNNTTFTLWMDAEGFPIRGELAVRYVPSDDARALKGKQINFTTKVSLTDINQPVSVDAPKTFITFDDLMSEITGKSKEEMKVERQSLNVSSLRSALKSYHEWTGAYPTTLMDLKKKHKEVTKKAAGASVTGNEALLLQDSSSLDKYYAEQPFAQSVPLDIFTAKAFEYKVVGDDYLLGYQVKVPPFVSGASPSDYYVNDNSDNSFQYGGLTPSYITPIGGTQRQKLILKFISGINHADAKDLSKEAKAASVADADGDGMPDVLEKVFGTDPKKVDSDGDGSSDTEEITSHSNPLGAGKLEVKSQSGFF